MAIAFCVTFDMPQPHTLCELSDIKFKRETKSGPQFNTAAYEPQPDIDGVFAGLVLQLYLRDCHRS